MTNNDCILSGRAKWPKMASFESYQFSLDVNTGQQSHCCSWRGNSQGLGNSFSWEACVNTLYRCGIVKKNFILKA